MLKQWLTRKFIARDTGKAIQGLRGIPISYQLHCAKVVPEDVLKTISAIEKTRKPSPECDSIIKPQAERGKSRKDLAIAMGAKNHKNPYWSAGALIESFAFSNTGNLSKKDTATIQQSIMGWLSATIPKSEMEATFKRLRLEG